jgi:hypothetical protein
MTVGLFFALCAGGLFTAACMTDPTKTAYWSFCFGSILSLTLSKWG